MRSLAVFLVALLLAPTVSFAAPIQCECVRYLREVLQVNVKGDAWTLRGNTDIRFARAGDVLLTDEGPGHAALITGFFEPTEGDLWVKIAETNFKKCTPGIRTIRLLDPSVRGVYRPSSYPQGFTRL